MAKKYRFVLLAILDCWAFNPFATVLDLPGHILHYPEAHKAEKYNPKPMRCLLYTSDAADEL